MALVLRLILAICLALGGLAASLPAQAHAPVPCHDPMAHDPTAATHHAPAHPAGHAALHCLADAGLCCVAALPLPGAVLPVSHAIAAAWAAPAADPLTGHPIEAATPPPRA